MTLTDFLRELAEQIRPATESKAHVAAAPNEGSDYQITVEPREQGLCRFTVFVEATDALSIRLGEFTAIDIHERELNRTMAVCRTIVECMLNGEIEETVWRRKDGRPCRSYTTIAGGREGTFRTAAGLCFRAVKQPPNRYRPYRS